ncbi:MAG: PAS domain S-box protein [Deltaproteobacteria bacterium]|jgi:PAS domain S-box-containing protein|nr:PAS domain S-box protein [Deltaproteobacteria bacterium]
MILKWMQRLGAVKTSLAITLIAVLGSVALELSFALISGDFRWIGLIKSMVFPGTIAPVVSYTVVRVVIKMIDSETALSESKEKYLSILDNIEDGYYEVNLKGSFTFFNNSLSRLLGYSPAAMAGMNYRQYMSSENAQKVYQTFNQVYKTGEPAKGFDWEIFKVDGSKGHLDASVTLMKDTNGVPIGFRGIVRDIAQRKQSENALRESEARYRQLLNHAPSGIYEIDLINGKFVSVNDVMCEYTGYTRHELLSMNALDILTEEGQTKSLERFDRIQKGEKVPASVEYKIKTKSGRELWALLNTKFLQDAEGRPTRILVVAHDIAELKQAQEEKKNLESQLQQAQKMEAIGTLAGGIAHDFNNILSVIIGYTELILMNARVDSEVRQNLKEIFNASKHARDMVKQILAFSRQNKQERKPIQVAHIVKEALKMLRASLPSTISIQQKIEKNTAIIEADPTQIHQVLMNLCTNAAHAIDEKDGELEISLANVELDQNAAAEIPDLYPGSFLKLSVRDTGDGIAPEALPQIFNPYFTTKEKGEGTGLGLAVVQGIIKSLNGAITVDSQVGHGSTFHVYLPTIKRESVKEEEMPTPLPMGYERILFVDDEQPLAEIGKQMLERLGYRVDTRTSSIEALNLFKADPNRFDLVITDIVMPNMTGDKLANEMMGIRPDIPIVLCTGYSEKFTRQHAADMGIECFLMKPLVMQDLAGTVRQALTLN